MIDCDLPYAGIKSFNDLWIKSNSFCHLREQSNKSPPPRCPVVELWQLTPRYVMIERGFVTYLVDLRHLLHPIPLKVCFVSQLKRCIYVSSPELIMSCSIFEKIDSLGFPVLLIVVLDEDLESKDVKINWSNESTSSRRTVGSWRSC